MGTGMETCIIAGDRRRGSAFLSVLSYKKHYAQAVGTSVLSVLGLERRRKKLKIFLFWFFQVYYIYFSGLRFCFEADIFLFLQGYHKEIEDFV